MCMKIRDVIGPAALLWSPPSWGSVRSHPNPKQSGEELSPSLSKTIDDVVSPTAYRKAAARG